MRTPESQQEIALKNMERAEAREARVVWAGSVANGALLIALIGLIGNVSDPDDAIQFLRWPLILLGCGVLVGGGCPYAFTRIGRGVLRSSGAAIDAARAEHYFREGRLDFAVRAAIDSVCTLVDKPLEELALDLSGVQTVDDFNKLAGFYRVNLRKSWCARLAWKRLNDICFILSFACLLLAGGVASACFAIGYRLQP